MPQVVALAVAIGEAASGAIATGAMAVGIGADTAIAIGNFAVNAGLVMGLNALATGLRGSSGGVQERAASGALTTRRLAVGKVWTAGSFATDPPISYDASNKRAFQVIWLADHECDGLEQVYVDGYPAQLSSYDSLKGWQVLYTVDPKTGLMVKDFRVGKPKFYIKYYSGADGQVADPWMVQELSGIGKWDSTCVGTNISYLVVYAYYDSDIFSRFPEFQVFFRGAKLYNPAKDSTVGGSGSHRWGSPSTYEWTANWAVIAYNLCRGFYVGEKLFYGCGYEAEDLPLDNWFAAIAACDEEVALKAGGTEPRYHGGCEFDVTKEVREALKTCEEATAGEICTFGAVRMYPGVAQTPVFSFSDSDMAYKSDRSAHPQSWDAFAGIDDTKNLFEGKFLDVAQQFATNDIPPRYSNDDIEACGGIPLRDTVQLTQIQSCPTAQRILEVMRRRSMAPGVAVRTFLNVALAANIGEWVAGTSADWIGTKWFRIAHIKVNDDATVTMTLREIPENLDDWNAANDELDSFGVSLPSAAPPDPLEATGIFATPISELGEDGSTTTGVFVGFDPVDDPTAAGGWVKWRLPGSNVENFIIVTADQLANGKISIYGLAGNTTYEYAVLISGIPGRSAVWSDWYLVTTAASQQTGINDANSSSIREVLGILDSLVQSLNETALITTDVRQTTRRQIKVAQDNLTASFTEQINAEISARQALASLVEQLTAQVGDISAEGLFAVDAEVNDSGAQATIGLRAKVSDSLVQATAALLLHSEIVSGVARSWAAVRAGSFYVQDDSGNNYAAFRGSDGALIVDRIISGSLSTGKVYMYGDGTTAKSAEDDTPIPADPPSIDLSAGKSVYYYDGNEYAAHGIPGFPVDTTANYIKVNGRFYFSVRNSSSNTTKAAIEAYNGATWMVIPHSVTPTHTNNTDTPAYISAEALLPNGTTHWRARIWNPTGNIIQLLSFTGFEDKQQK